MTRRYRSARELNSLPTYHVNADGFALTIRANSRAEAVVTAAGRTGVPEERITATLIGGRR